MMMAMRRLTTRSCNPYLVTQWNRYVHVNGNQVRTGMTLEIDQKLFKVQKATPVKPGKGGAYMQCELKDILQGTKQNKRFRASESVEKADLGKEQPYQYLYTTSDDVFVFMHVETFDQIEISRKIVGPGSKYLTQDTQVLIQEFNGEPVIVELPNRAVIRVVSTPDQIKGLAFSSANYKDATLDNGAVVLVPQYVASGDLVKIEIETGAFIERVH